MQLMLLLLALRRNMEHRFKAANQAYWSVITLKAREGKNRHREFRASPTHAGGVVFRVRRGRAEYLLVEARDDPT